MGSRADSNSGQAPRIQRSLHAPELSPRYSTTYRAGTKFWFICGGRT